MTHCLDSHDPRQPPGAAKAALIKSKEGLRHGDPLPVPPSPQSHLTSSQGNGDSWWPHNSGQADSTLWPFISPTAVLIPTKWCEPTPT